MTQFSYNTSYVSYKQYVGSVRDMLIAIFYLTLLPDSLDLNWGLIQGLYRLFVVFVLPDPHSFPCRNYWSEFRVDMPDYVWWCRDVNSVAEEKRHKKKTQTVLWALVLFLQQSPAKARRVFYDSFLLFPPLRCAENYIKLHSEPKGFISSAVHVQHGVFCVTAHYCKCSHFLLLPRHALSGSCSLWKRNVLENTFLDLKDF